MSRATCRSLVAFGLALLALDVGCSRTSAPQAGADRPNVLWIVWDTVRADHLSLHGYERATTPNLDAFAASATVFTDCVSPAGTTVPSHVSMFTGLLPDEHGAHNERPVLADATVTVAERARDAGYRTYLFSENPYISNDYGTAQGFERVEHPWDPQYVDEAVRITAAKLGDAGRADRFMRNTGAGRVNPRRVKAAGELAQRGLEAWLSSTDEKRPFLALLNYMEAHHPLVPPREFRARFMDAAQVDASFRLDRSWARMWDYTLGLAEWSDEDLWLQTATYDAAIAELDTLFAALLDGLRTQGRLDNTIVVVTSDHGEHLGEKHLLDHQFSAYEPLLRVPLVVHAPGALPAGRDARPVSTIDLHPTLLRLCGVSDDAARPGITFDLSTAPEERRRLGACPAPMLAVLQDARRRHPAFDPSPWRRSIHALYEGAWKLIAGSDGRTELYNVVADPLEQNDLLKSNAAEAERLLADLGAWRAALRSASATGGGEAPLTPAQRKRLEALGYLPGSDDEGASDGDEEAEPDGAEDSP